MKKEANMSLFHNYSFHWWQVSMLKLALLAFGIILGASWPIFWKKRVIWSLLWVIFIVLVIYLVIAAWPQM